MTERTPQTRRREGLNPLVKTVFLISLAVDAVAGTSKISEAMSNNNPENIRSISSPTLTETPRPSAASASPSHTETQKPVAQQEAQIPLDHKLTVNEASRLLGVPTNLIEINQFGGATVDAKKLDDNGISVNLVPGMVLDASIKVPGEVNDQMGIVVEGNVDPEARIRLRGFTAWFFGVANEQAGALQVVSQQRTREKIEQPGVLTLAACPTPESTSFVGLSKTFPQGRTGQEQAAQEFGVAGEPSSNPDVWRVNQFGAAFIPAENLDNKGTRVKVLPGVVVDASLIVPGEKNNQMGIVLQGSVTPEGVARIRGGTFWEFGVANEQAGALQVVSQQRTREKTEQPGVLTIRFCPVETSPKIQSAPTATPLPSAK